MSSSIPVEIQPSDGMWEPSVFTSIPTYGESITSVRMGDVAVPLSLEEIRFGGVDTFQNALQDARQSAFGGGLIGTEFDTTPRAVVDPQVYELVDRSAVLLDQFAAVELPPPAELHPIVGGIITQPEIMTSKNKDLLDQARISGSPVDYMRAFASYQITVVRNEINADVEKMKRDAVMSMFGVIAAGSFFMGMHAVSDEMREIERQCEYIQSVATEGTIRADCVGDIVGSFDEGEREMYQKFPNYEAPKRSLPVDVDKI